MLKTGGFLQKPPVFLKSEKRQEKEEEKEEEERDIKKGENLRRLRWQLVL